MVSRLTSEGLERQLQATPSDRLTTAQDLAGGVLFLLPDRARHTPVPLSI